MSRLPGPDEQWVESTEGDLDPDLAEEWDWPEDDWDRAERPWWPLVQRFVLALLIASLVVPGLLLVLR